METFADFGEEAEKYQSARRGYPHDLFLFLKKFAKPEEPVLDLGCGTGIATRQLVLAGFEDVQGLDIDERMIEVAQLHKEWKHISYWTGSVVNMRFRSRKFKVLTAFSSFHWFQDNGSIQQMRRVLMEKGLLFICRKEDSSSWTDKIRQAIEEEMGKGGEIPPFDEAKKRLVEGGFLIQEERAFPGEDLYSLELAKEYIRSISHWSLIPREKKIEFMDRVLVPILQSHQTRGAILRTYEAKVIVAIKAGPGITSK